MSKKFARLDEFFKKQESSDSSTDKTVEESEETSELPIEANVPSKGGLAELIREFEAKISIPELKTLPRRTYDIRSLLREHGSALIVTEKPKVAAALAKVLGNARKINFGKLTTFELTWQGHKIFIVPMRGHITEILPTKDFSGRWEDTDPIKLLDPNSLREIVVEKDVEKALEYYARRTSLLVIATDADEEGSNIGFEAYKVVKKVNPKVKVVRMWFLSVQPSELRKSFLTPIEPKWSWALAVQARRLIDAMIGFSATRELTITLRDLAQALRVSAFSIGRVQTPTLYLLFLREREIKTFVPEPYWTFSVTTDVNGFSLTFKPVNSPYKDYKRALSEFEAVKRSRSVFIKKVEKKFERKLPPSPLDTTLALSMINDVLGIPSRRAMKILEDLYLNGLITYPRTETNKYPPDYDHARNLKVLANHPELGKFARQALARGAKLTRNGTRFVGDHLPITPIDLALPGDKRLPSREHALVYELIVRRYLALFLEPAEIEKVRVLGEAGGVRLSASFSRLVKQGFIAVYLYSQGESYINVRLEGVRALPIKSVSSLEKRFTEPPSRLKESELIRLMERLGLGTKSTRPDHIETLVSRRYITRKGKTLVVTPLGYTLAEHLEKIWPEFLKPFFSAKVHALMRKVMNEELDWREMVEIVRKEFLDLFLKLREHIKSFRGAFEKAAKSIIESSYIMECPKCGGKMIVIPLAGRKLSLLKCTSCGYSLSIPKAEKYIKANVRCKRCGSYILILRRRDSTVLVCPVCWKEVGPCTKCPELKTCDAKKVIEEELGVGKCSCGQGMLLFVKKLGLVLCDSCNKKYFLPKEAKSVRLLKERCPSCGLRLFSFRFPGKRKRVKFCVRCRKYYS